MGAAYGLRQLARATLKLIPGAGWATSAAVAYAGTLAIGEAAIRYFVYGKSEAEARQQYQQEFKKRKQEHEENEPEN